MHHLRLAGPPSPAPTPRPGGPGFLLRHHELGPFALEAAGGEEVPAEHALRVLFDGGLVGVEAFELDDGGGVGGFAFDVDAGWG